MTLRKQPVLLPFHAQRALIVFNRQKALCEASFSYFFVLQHRVFRSIHEIVEGGEARAWPHEPPQAADAYLQVGRSSRFSTQ